MEEAVLYGIVSIRHLCKESRLIEERVPGADICLG